jgi:hypothetical protein
LYSGPPQCGHRFARLLSANSTSIFFNRIKSDLLCRISDVIILPHLSGRGVPLSNPVKKREGTPLTSPHPSRPFYIISPSFIAAVLRLHQNYRKKKNFLNGNDTMKKSMYING